MVVSLTFIKFSFVGFLTFLINIVSLYILTDIKNVEPIVAAIIIFIFIVIVQYTLNNIWSFKEIKVKNKITGALKYTIITISASFIYLSLFSLFVYVFDIYVILSAVFATVLSFIPKFIACKLFVWRTVNARES